MCMPPDGMVPNRPVLLLEKVGWYCLNVQEQHSCLFIFYWSIHSVFLSSYVLQLLKPLVKLQWKLTGHDEMAVHALVWRRRHVVMVTAASFQCVTWQGRPTSLPIYLYSLISSSPDVTPLWSQQGNSLGKGPCLYDNLSHRIWRTSQLRPYMDLYTEWAECVDSGQLLE